MARHPILFKVIAALFAMQTVSAFSPKPQRDSRHASASVSPLCSGCPVVLVLEGVGSSVAV